MNQYNRLLDPKKDLGKYSGTLAIYLFIMTMVGLIWGALFRMVLFGSLRKDPSKVLEKMDVWAGVPYFIAIAIYLPSLSRLFSSLCLYYDASNRAHV